jgi:hypothetical protein
VLHCPLQYTLHADHTLQSNKGRSGDQGKYSQRMGHQYTRPYTCSHIHPQGPDISLQLHKDWINMSYDLGHIQRLDFRQKKEDMNIVSYDSQSCTGHYYHMHYVIDMGLNTFPPGIPGYCYIEYLYCTPLLYNLNLWGLLVFP